MDGAFLASDTGRMLGRSLLRVSLVIGLRLAAHIAPVIDPHIRRQAFLASVPRDVLTKREGAIQSDEPPFGQAGLADALGHGLSARAVEEGGVLVGSELLIHSHSEGNELALILALTELRVVDQSANQSDSCICHLR